MKSKVVFVADFFREQINGGAESNDGVLINRLSELGFDITTVASSDVSVEFVLENRGNKFIISNFVRLSKDAMSVLASACDYIIYEHDHKYVSTRDPSVFVDFLIPKHRIVNREFYENATSVVVLSNICKEVLEKNLELTNVHSIGCSLWAKEKFELIRELSKNKKDSGTVIVESRNPTKGMPAAIRLCEQREMEYSLISSADEEEFLSMLSKAERLVFVPQVLETFCRLIAEAKMLGCKVVTMPKLLGFSSEDCFSMNRGELTAELERRVEDAIGFFKDSLDSPSKKIETSKSSAVTPPLKRKNPGTIICGAKKYQNLNFDNIVDSFDEIVRTNMLLPGSGYGKKLPSKQVMNNHVYNNFVKNRMTNLTKYTGEHKIEMKHLVSFASFLDEFKRENAHTYAENNTAFFKNLVKREGIDIEIQKELRCGFAYIAECLKQDIKPFLIGFSLVERDFFEKNIYNNSKKNTWGHSIDTEILLLKELHRLGFVDASLCTIKDEHSFEFDRKLLTPTHEAEDILKDIKEMEKEQ